MNAFADELTDVVEFLHGVGASVFLRIVQSCSFSVSFSGPTAHCIRATTL